MRSQLIILDFQWFTKRNEALILMRFCYQNTHSCWVWFGWDLKNFMKSMVGLFLCAHFTSHTGCMLVKSKSLENDNGARLFQL